MSRRDTGFCYDLADKTLTLRHIMSREGQGLRALRVQTGRYFNRKR